MKLIRPDEQKALRAKVKPKHERRTYPAKYRYFLLACDHFTTTEVQEAYSVWRTSPDLYLCEICGIEVEGKPSREIPRQPDKPPF